MKLSEIEYRLAVLNALNHQCSACGRRAPLGTPANPDWYIGPCEGDDEDAEAVCPTCLVAR